MREDRAKQLAEDFLSGRIKCDDCSNLNQLIEDVRVDKISREQFIEIIQNHLNRLGEVT